MQQSRFVEIQGKKTPSNVNINPISNKLFLEKMAACTGIITTAGFETVCEGAYLNKPIYMLPIAKHYEQLTNALDGERAKVGITSQKMDIDFFRYYIRSKSYPKRNNKYWFSQVESYILKEIEVVQNSVLV